MTLSIKTFSITTLSIKTLSIKTLSINTLSIKTLSIKSLNEMGLFAALSINDIQHNAFSVIMRSVEITLMLC